MKQLSLPEDGIRGEGRQANPEGGVFPEEMETVVPWSRLEGLIDTMTCTTAKVADITKMEACLHGAETVALGDRGYHKTNRTIGHFEKEGELPVTTPIRKPKGTQLMDEQKAFNRTLSAVRAIAEPPFRGVKRQSGSVKLRYRGLAKNTWQMVTLFALANLRLARKRLLPLVGEVRP